MLNGISSLHTVMLRLVPAFGAVTTVTTTFAEAFGQGGVPFTVYTYVPGTEVPGVNMLLTGFPDKVQAPPASGDPPSRVMRSTAGPLLQVFKLPGVPALASGITVTTTLAEAFGQGGVPVTVYV